MEFRLDIPPVGTSHECYRDWVKLTANAIRSQARGKVIDRPVRVHITLPERDCCLYTAARPIVDALNESAVVWRENICRLYVTQGNIRKALVEVT